MSLAISFTLLPLHILSPLSSISIVLKLTLHAVSIIQLLLFDDEDNADRQIHRFSVVFSQSLGKPSIYDMLHLVAIAIYTISRVISTGRGGKLNILDKVFIYWSFLGHTVNILARVLVTRYLVVPQLWHRYLASFDDEHLQRSHNNESAHPEEGQTKSTSARQRDILSPLSDSGVDTDLAAEMLLTPPWDSYPQPLSRQQTRYGWPGDHRHQDVQWESPYDNESIWTYPPPTEVYHAGIHSPIAPGRSENNPRKSQGLWGIVLPAWSKVSGMVSLPTIMTKPGNSLRVLNSPTEEGRYTERTGIFRRSRKGTEENLRKKKRRRQLRTDSMVVEVPDTEAGSEHYGYDRTSWRSGDYLLGEARSGR